MPGAGPEYSRSRRWAWRNRFGWLQRFPRLLRYVEGNDPRPFPRQARCAVVLFLQHIQAIHQPDCEVPGPLGGVGKQAWSVVRQEALTLEPGLIHLVRQERTLLGIERAPDRKSTRLNSS